MSFLHTDPAPLERLLRRVFRLGDHGCGMRYVGLLCKPLVCHHFHIQASACPEISFRAGFRYDGNTVHRQKPQRENAVTRRKASLGTSFLRQSVCKSVRPFWAVFGA